MNWPERLELFLSPEQRHRFLERIPLQVSPQDYRHIESLCQLVATIGQDNLTKLQLAL